MKRLSVLTAVAVSLLLAAGCDNKKTEVAQQAPEIKPATPKADEPAPLEPLEARPAKTVKAPKVTSEPEVAPIEVVTPAPAEPAASAKPAKAGKNGKAKTAAKAAEPAAPATVNGKTYTVQKGDTLTKIARTQYNNPKRVKDIIAANPGINPDKIKPGQVINLPD